MDRTFRRLGLAAVLAVSVVATGAAGASAAPHPAGAVYVLGNDAAANSVIKYDRAADGTLTPAATFFTGGLGAGRGLGSQGALILAQGNSRLFAVNAGSNEVSSFNVHPSGLSLVSTVPSGGELPISLTVHGHFLYVLNAGGDGNISAFTVGHSGGLFPLSGSTRPLSGSGVGPAQVQFSPNGRVLVVTEKNTNLIDTYTVGSNGLATGPTTHPSSGATPFGFGFDKRSHLIVSEAFGSAPDASAVSSYIVADDGSIGVISGSVKDTETAACWIVTTEGGRFTYTTNTGSASVSGYAIGPNGSLTLLDAGGVTGTTGAGPIDAALSAGSHYLYTNDSGGHDISVFQVGSLGHLTPLTGVGGLPASAVGLAAV
jgi:6-phosphogluconolactonase